MSPGINSGNLFKESLPKRDSSKCRVKFLCFVSFFVLKKIAQKGDITQKGAPNMAYRSIPFEKGNKINPQKTKNPTGDFFHHVTPASKNNVFLLQ